MQSFLIIWGVARERGHEVHAAVGLLIRKFSHLRRAVAGARDHDTNYPFQLASLDPGSRRKILVKYHGTGACHSSQKSSTENGQFRASRRPYGHGTHPCCLAYSLLEILSQGLECKYKSRA